MEQAISQVLYPILPLKDTVLLPGILLPVAVGHPRAIAAVEATQISEDAKIVVAVQRDASKETGGLDDLFPTATLAVVHKVVPAQDNVQQVFLRGVERVRLGEVTASSPYLQATVTSLGNPQDASEATTALFRNIRALVGQAVQQLGGVPQEMAALLMQTEDPAALAYRVAMMLNVETEYAVDWLAIDELPDLLTQVHDRLSQEVKILDLQQKIAGDAKGELDKTQRDYILRQQLKQIKKELGEDNEQQDTELLRQQLAAADLPDDIRPLCGQLNYVARGL